MAKKSDERNIKSKERIVEIIFRLLSGETLNVKEIAEEYHIGEHAIYNDFNFIEEKIALFTPDYSISSSVKRHLITEGKVNFEKTLALLKIVTGSQIFCKDELNDIIDSFTNVAPSDSKKALKQLTAVTTAGYRPRNDKPLLADIKLLSECILNKKAIDFHYNGSLLTDDPTKLRHGVPLSLYFDTHYFYVLTYLLDKEKNHTLRVDRFIDIAPSNKAVNIPYDKKIDESRMINEMFLLHGGNYIHYKFRYHAKADVTLDNVPNSRISKDDDPNNRSETIVEGDLYMQGALMWAMGQGSKVEVLEPQSLKDALKKRLEETLNLYK